MQNIVLYTIIEMLQSKKAPETVGIGQLEIDNFETYYNQDSPLELSEKLMKVSQLSAKLTFKGDKVVLPAILSSPDPLKRF